MESVMKVNVVESFYSEELVFDVPTYALQQVRNPLYIGARTGQVGRVHKIMAEKKIAGVSIGAWELEKYGYLNEDGTLNKTNLKRHGIVFMARPVRIPAHAKLAYLRLINALEDL
jgi:hypothetical protein